MEEDETDSMLAAILRFHIGIKIINLVKVNFSIISTQFSLHIPNFFLRRSCLYIFPIESYVKLSHVVLAYLNCITGPGQCQKLSANLDSNVPIVVREVDLQTNFTKSTFVHIAKITKETKLHGKTQNYILQKCLSCTD